jgi:hypothetical protein
MQPVVLSNSFIKAQPRALSFRVSLDWIAIASWTFSPTEGDERPTKENLGLSSPDHFFSPTLAGPPVLLTTPKSLQDSLLELDLSLGNTVRTSRAKAYGGVNSSSFNAPEIGLDHEEHILETGISWPSPLVAFGRVGIGAMESLQWIDATIDAITHDSSGV